MADAAVRHEKAAAIAGDSFAQIETDRVGTPHVLERAIGSVDRDKIN